MKFQFQIVGDQQYEYIMQEGEFDSPEAAVAAYKALREAHIPKTGLPTAEFNKALERYLTDGTGETDEFARMGTVKVFSQQDLFKEINKCLKRINK